MTSAERNLVKTIPGTLSEQRELLDLRRSHLEEKYPLLFQRMLDDGKGCVLDTTGYWLREDDVGVACAL